MRCLLLSILIILNLVLNICFAKAWPVFAPPDKQLLLHLNLINTSQCIKGHGQLINKPIKIHERLCKNFCPDDWEWITSKNDHCFNLLDFNFKGFRIRHVKNQISYSVITAAFGPKNSDKILFKYVMKTLPGEYSYCVIIDQERNLISCANDR